MKRPRDENILDKISQGDQASFAKFYNLYVDKLYRFILLKVSSKEKAEEITQDVFWQFWQTASRQKINSGLGLLYKIARARVIDLYRSEERRPENSFPLEDIPDDYALAENDLDSILDLRYEMETVRSALTEIKDEERELIVMRYIDQLKIKEIAAVIAKNEGHTRVLIYRALRSLRQKMDQLDK